MMTLGTVPKNIGAEWGLAYGMAMTMKSTDGFAVGNYVITTLNEEDYKCEITSMTQRRVQLVGIGWVDKKKCRFKQ